MSTGSDRNPYDAFVYKAFAHPDAARELALNLVPSEYYTPVSTGRISVQTNRFVDSTLRNRYTDLLVRARPTRHAAEGDDATDLLVYVLIEHTSNPDRWVALQMLRYLAVIWEDERRKRPDTMALPRIIPVVLYHGTRVWRASIEFADLVDGTQPGDRHIPHFRPFFVNLADVPEEQLLGSVRTVTALLFLKYVKQSLHAVGRQMMEILRRAHGDPAAREIASLGLRTLAAVKDSGEMEQLQTIAREARYDSIREDEMTYAEELRQEGLELGLRRGVAQGVLADKRAVLKRLLSRRFSLDAAERGRIESCEDRNALDAALDEVVIAEDKHAVLARLP